MEYIVQAYFFNILPKTQQFKNSRNFKTQPIFSPKLSKFVQNSKIRQLIIRCYNTGDASVRCHYRIWLNGYNRNIPSSPGKKLNPQEDFFFCLTVFHTEDVNSQLYLHVQYVQKDTRLTT